MFKGVKNGKINFFPKALEQKKKYFSTYFILKQKKLQFKQKQIKKFF